MHKYNISVVTRLNTTPSRPRTLAQLPSELEAHLEQSRKSLAPAGDSDDWGKRPDPEWS